MSARVGILGGTFNPPHVGHLVCAQEAFEQLELDRVLLVPAGVPPHKAVAEDPGAECRYELCRWSVEGDARFEVSRLELDRPGPSYTADTLRELRRQRPDVELVLILGGDMALALPGWHEPEAVLELAKLAVAEREGAKRLEIDAALAPLGAGDVRFFAMPRVDVSSSMVRERAAAGRSVRYLVAPPVAERIEREGLYRTRTGARA